MVLYMSESNATSHLVISPELIHQMNSTKLQFKNTMIFLMDSFSEKKVVENFKNIELFKEKVKR